MSDRSIPTYFFVLAVVRRGNEFLLVQERKFDQSWYLPAGRVERGERFVEALRREAREETGIDVEVEGVLRVEQGITAGGVRIRIFFLARPLDDRAPKNKADEHSLRAAWVEIDVARRLRLRDREVLSALEYVAQGGAVQPSSILVDEGAPWVTS